MSRDFLLVTNFCGLYSASMAKRVLTDMFEEERARFGRPESIRVETRIGTDLLSERHRAFVTYADTSIHTHVAEFYNNRLLFGTHIEVRITRLSSNDIRVLNQNNAMQLNANTDLSPSNNVSNLITNPSSQTEENNDMHTLPNMAYESVQFTTQPLSNIQHNTIQSSYETAQSTQIVLNERISERENITIPRLTTLIRALSAPSSQSLYNSNGTSPLSRVAPESLNNEETGNNFTSKTNQIEAIRSFKCSRCKTDFGICQDVFEEHVDFCKINDAISTCVLLRKAKCSSCKIEFAQVKSEDLSFLPCGHLLHKNCLRQLAARYCPFCDHYIPSVWDGNIYLN